MFNISCLAIYQQLPKQLGQQKQQNNKHWFKIKMDDDNPLNNHTNHELVNYGQSFT